MSAVRSAIETGTEEVKQEGGDKSKKPNDLTSSVPVCTDWVWRYRSDGQADCEVLWNNPSTGVMRHAGAAYEIGVECAKELGLKLPMV